MLRQRRKGLRFNVSDRRYEQLSVALKNEMYLFLFRIHIPLAGIELG